MHQTWLKSAAQKDLPCTFTIFGMNCGCLETFLSTLQDFICFCKAFRPFKQFMPPVSFYTLLKTSENLWLKAVYSGKNEFEIFWLITSNFFKYIFKILKTMKMFKLEYFIELSSPWKFEMVSYFEASQKFSLVVPPSINAFSSF